MRYKFELSVMNAVVLGLLLAGVASADSVTKTLYVDGVKVGTSTTTQAISYPYPRLTIGAEGSRYYCYNGLVGEIDEFAVYGYVLTDANVAAHYSAAPAGYRAAVNADQPLLYLQFEDANSNQGSKAANSGSAADMNITYIGAVGQDATGYIGKAAVLHGANGGTGDCIDVCDYSLQLSTTDVSVEFWLKTTQNSDYPRFFQHNGGNTEQHSYGAMYNAGTNTVGLIGGGSTGYINSTLNDGAWHHIVVTYNSIKPGPYATEVMADDPCVYITFNNQMPVDSSANDYFVGFTGNYQAIGGYPQVKKTAGGMGLSLYMDNTIRLSGAALAVAYVWNNNLAGTLLRQSPPLPWNVNSDDYAFVTGSISFEIWIKSVPGLTELSDTYGMIFQQIGAYTKEPNLNVRGSGPALGLYTDAGVRKLRVAAGNQWFYPGTVAPFDGQWHQLVVTYDPNADGLGYSMGVQLYLDGSLAGQTTVTDPNGNALLANEVQSLMIGCENDEGWPYTCYSGYVDEFAIYAGVLSADRVAAHYAAWQPKNCAEVMARGMTLPGDLNGDCQVDIYDFAILASQWHLCDDPGAGCPSNW
ncbi:MAG: LamG-like jellyroll fold domain-containing protein [Sedimentisphaerales bacterium]